MARFRPTTLTCLLVVGCASGTDQPVQPATPETPRVFAFGPSTTTYLVSSYSTIEQNIQGMAQTTQTELRFRLVTDVLASDSGLQTSLVVDSILLVSMPGVSNTDVDRVRGSRFAATLQPTGELADIDAMESNSPLFRVITNSVSQFFPRIPDSGLPSGATWTDTTEVMGNNGAADITTSAITVHETSDWTQAEGQDALTISWQASYTYAGEGEQLGQPFTIQGKGRRTGRYHLAADGRYLGSTMADSSTADVVVTNLGITVPLQTIRADTVSVISQ